MSRNIEVGVFIPVGKNGWIHSVNTPYTPGSFQHVLDVVQRSEALGFDFVLSPAIWRGRKGPSRHWMDSLESLTTTAALLQATSRIEIFGTVHMTVFPPATIAKMIATLDQIGAGRVGLNLVTGSSYLDLAHLGLWNDELNHDERYDMADEWVHLVKRLWTEEIVDHKGRFFATEAATMGPKPSRMPKLVNAGASPRGIKFAADNCDIAFISASDGPKFIATARQCKEAARAMGKPNLKTFGLVTVIPGETDAEAQARLDHFNAGVDRECLADIAAGYEQNRSAKALSEASLSLTGGEKQSCVMPGELVGSYETLARRLSVTALEGELDGLMLVVPDYIEDLAAIANRTLPLMERYGVSSLRSR
ncbi:luciferase family protein [Rhizorhabdus wittichii RW1]|uniref:Luciferase family protein n=2 Tax=Rhizorhabdus wittichii TaxID=160791 RepID=A0A9J9HF03_RHIWR|nr:LLM class flavin-dependent oxidoreductase [Rhizorhabdus wittichii]ABQ70556.1 luciferase family protein [Rhizorhabdus wittichii RW1]QTH23920.1 LLM class flavin-dependent oxidoreductase [Rhizorhabdus wittichii]